MQYNLLKNFLIWDKWSFDPIHKVFVFYTCFFWDEDGNKLYKAKVWWGPESYKTFFKCLANKKLRENYILSWARYPV